MFARQVDHIIREPECDFVKREIRVLDLFREHDIVISILASKRGGTVGPHYEFPYLELLSGDTFVVGLDQGDFVQHLFTASTHDSLMFFTQTGRCYVEKVYEIPEMGRASKGRSIANLLELRPEEKIAATLRIEAVDQTGVPKGEEGTWNSALHVMFATRSGIVKKTNLADFANVRKGGIIAIQIESDDALIDALLTNGMDEVVLITRMLTPPRRLEG